MDKFISVEEKSLRNSFLSVYVTSSTMCLCRTIHVINCVCRIEKNKLYFFLQWHVMYCVFVCPCVDRPALVLLRCIAFSNLPSFFLSCAISCAARKSSRLNSCPLTVCLLQTLSPLSLSPSCRVKNEREGRRNGLKQTVHSVAFVNDSFP